MERVVERRAAVAYQPDQTAAQIGSQQQAKPRGGNDTAGVEDQAGLGKLILPHGRFSVFPVS